MCHKHSVRLKAHGSTDGFAPWVDLTDEERFWTKVDRSGDCWSWTGERNNSGYGRFATYHDGKRIRYLAHRYAIGLRESSNRDVVVMHQCDNPPCVNPDHLRMGTQVENIRDAMEKGRLDMSGLALGAGMRGLDPWERATLARRRRG